MNTQNKFRTVFLSNFNNNNNFLIIQQSGRRPFQGSGLEKFVVASAQEHVFHSLSQSCQGRYDVMDANR